MFWMADSFCEIKPVATVNKNCNTLKAVVTKMAPIYQMIRSTEGKKRLLSTNHWNGNIDSEISIIGKQVRNISIKHKTVTV